MKIFLALFAIVVMLGIPAQSQDTPNVPEADPADVESVDAIMAAVYDVIIRKVMRPPSIHRQENGSVRPDVPASSPHPVLPDYTSPWD